MKLLISLVFTGFLFVLCLGSCDPVSGNNDDVTDNPEEDIPRSVKSLAPDDTLKNSTNSFDSLAMENTDTTKKYYNPVEKQEPDIEYLMGKITLKGHPDFVQMSLEHCSDKNMYLRKEAYAAFKEMFGAAKKDGISLRIISATRPFNRQKQIWEAKWSGVRLVGGKDLSKSIPEAGERALKILEYSSMPGTSRHHWGTDIDINNLENSYFETGSGKKEYEWLTSNASRFGFCQPYTEKTETGRTGYEEEKWHWSYIPISKKLTKSYKENINEDMITGFKGSESAKIIGVIDKYVLGIHPDCLKYTDY